MKGIRPGHFIKEVYCLNRLEILLLEREKILTQLATQEDRTKCVVALMDIDDELEEMKFRSRKMMVWPSHLKSYENQGRNVQ